MKCKCVIFHKINLGLLQRYCFKRTANALLKYSEVLFLYNSRIVLQILPVVFEKKNRNDVNKRRFLVK
jgi:hypothetical protein